MLKPSKLIRTLRSLPGGNSQYLETMTAILEWIATTESPTKEQCLDWIEVTYSASRAVLTDYLQLLIRLDIVSQSKTAGLLVTEFGQQVLHAEGDRRAQLVAEQMLPRCIAMPEVLALYAQVGRPIHINEVSHSLRSLFPRWQSSNPFDNRTYWLHSLNCVHQGTGRYFEITELGRRLTEKYAPSGEVIYQQIIPSLPARTSARVEKFVVTDIVVGELIEDLYEAARDSDAFTRLEIAIANAFNYLGFSVRHLGHSGQTDVILEAKIGPETYSVVVDGKARREGILHKLEFYVLEEHRQKNQATYAMVIAETFGGGHLPKRAAETGVVLLSIEVLVDWLTLHDEIPLNLTEYRSMFEVPGVLVELPPGIRAAAEKRQRWARLFTELSLLLKETYQNGLNVALAANQLFTMLAVRLQGVHYSDEEIRKAIALLTHPALGCALGGADGSVVLAIAQNKLSTTLRSLADLIDYEQLSRKLFGLLQFTLPRANTTGKYDLR